MFIRSRLARILLITILLLLAACLGLYLAKNQPLSITRISALAYGLVHSKVKEIAYVAEGGEIAFIDYVNGNNIRAIATGQPKLVGIAINEGETFIISGGSDGTINRTDINSLKVARLFLIPDKSIREVLMTSDDNYVVVSASDGYIYVWDLINGSMKVSWKAHNDTIQDICINPSNNNIISVSRDGYLKEWSIFGGKPLIISDEASDISAIDINSDGSILAVARFNTTSNFELWNVKDWKLILKDKIHNGLIYSLKFSGDGRMLATGSGGRGNAAESIPTDDTIKIWDVSNSNLKLIRSFNAHSESINHLEFSFKGDVVLSLSDDRTLKAWKIE